MTLSPKSPRLGQPVLALADDLLVDEILTRVPALTVVRCRAVFRAWRDALTSQRFVHAHRAARAAAARHPEIVFFAPAANPGATAFYTCTLLDGPPPDVVRELATAHSLRGQHVVMLTKPCHGLTLLFDSLAPTEYHVCNLSTGEHVALPPCQMASEVRCSSVGLCFDASASRYTVVRLYESSKDQLSCEVHTLGSSEWRPCVGQLPRVASSLYSRTVATNLEGRPPVWVDGSFYWPMRMYRGAPEAPILSFSVVTEEFRWVHTPEHLWHRVSHLADLDGSLCAVVDARFTADEYSLWTCADPGSPSSWSLRCRISLATLASPMGDKLGGCGLRLLPLLSSGGKLLLASSRHEVFAYDIGSNSMEKVFSMRDFVDITHEAEVHLNIGVHEESVLGVSTAGDARLKMKLGTGAKQKRGHRGGELAGLDFSLRGLLDQIFEDTRSAAI